MPNTFPSLHSCFLDRLTARIAQDSRIDALLGAGSLLHGGLDEHSDVDCIVVVRPVDYADVMATRQEFAAELGDLVAAFTGEHVGEPRLLICLYGPAALHVDLKFVRLEDMTEMVERPRVLWARDAAAVETRLAAARVAWPDRAPDWFEVRFWIWLHYAATKQRRGEFFEALAALAFVRDQVLGPMLHRRAGRPQRGVRRLELADPLATRHLLPTLAGHDAGEIAAALRAAVTLYLDLRTDAPPTKATSGMPGMVLPFLELGK